MEEEITPVAATNGVAASEETVAEREREPEADVPNAWEEANNAVEGEEEAADAGDVVYMEEGNAAAHVEPQAVAETATVAATAAAQDEEAETEHEMGEAEYLEDELPDDERELSEGEEEEEAATAAPADKTNAEVVDDANEENKDETTTTTTATAAAEAEAAVEERTENETDTAKEAVEELVEEVEVEVDEEGDELEEGEEDEEEAELITGDDAQEQLAAAGEATDQTIARARSGGQSREQQVDENQCRVCTTKEQLVSLFTKIESEASTPADMLLLICPNVSIALKDFMPQFICGGCLESLTVAIKLRKQLETTERDLRKRLSRSKNKVRRPRGYVVIDAPVSESASEDDEEELNDDVEFKVSDVAGSTSADSDSADTDISEKRKPGRRRARKKPMKRSAGGNNSHEEDGHKKRSLQTPLATQGPFECDQCDLSFPRKQSYVMHRKMHDSRHEFHCQICNKKFKVRGAYKTHMERHAAERAQFRCELCAQVFRLRVELKRHMALSHDEHGIIYECKRCQRTFLTQQRLQRHQSTSCVRHSEPKVKRQAMEGHPSQGRDLFKAVAPLTTTYWSDSFSD